MGKFLLNIFGTKMLGVAVGAMLSELFANPVINFLNSHFADAMITPEQIDTILVSIPAIAIAYIAGDSVRKTENVG